MALKIVDTASLDAVANALNESARTSGAINFPDGFVDKANELANREKLLGVINRFVVELDENDLKGLTKIGANAFMECFSLKKISIPSTCTIISYYSFRHCQRLEKVSIPNSVVLIDTGAFWDCRVLKSIKIPHSVANIQTRAFLECWLMETIDLTDYGADKPFPALAETTEVFKNCGRDTASGFVKIIVPHGRKSALAAMTNWSSFASQIVDDIKGNWTFNDSVGTTDINKTFNIKGVYEGKEFNTIHLGLDGGYNYIAIDGEQIHDSGMWFGSKEIVITQSYAEIEDGVELMTWFNANATAV